MVVFILKENLCMMRNLTLQLLIIILVCILPLAIILTKSCTINIVTINLILFTPQLTTKLPKTKLLYINLSNKQTL